MLSWEVLGDFQMSTGGVERDHCTERLFIDIYLVNCIPESQIAHFVSISGVLWRAASAPSLFTDHRLYTQHSTLEDLITLTRRWSLSKMIKVLPRAKTYRDYTEGKVKLGAD